MFKVHVIQAEFGDSMLVEYGNSNHPKYILIDGGPSDVYDNSLKSELTRIVGEGGALEAVIITHVDIDHIKGIIDFLAELQGQRDDGGTPYLTVKELWLNTFGKTIDTTNALSARMNTLLTNAAANNIAMASSTIAVNGIKEGNRIKTLCNILGIPMNSLATSGIFRVGSPNNPINFYNLEFIIVGPPKENLEALKVEWEEWIEARENEMAAGNFNILSMSDKSIPNLSSIMFLVTGGNKTILFTGDGRGDHLLEGLKKKGLLKNGKLHIDILKVAHHGSDRNTDRGFFEKITADKYVISANGKHNNPDYATLTWIVEAANEAGRQVELIITNETPTTKKLVKDYPPDEWGYEINYIPDGELSVEV